MNDNDYFRQMTRRERYQNKSKTAVKLPFSVATVNFGLDVNIAYIIRSAVCFGIEELYIIGKMPDRSKVNSLSGSTFDYITFKEFSNPLEFLKFSRANNINLISLETPNELVQFSSFYDFNFDFKKQNCIILGHETLGISVDILINSTCLFIPMDGKGYCLNNSQCGNIVMYEVAKQFKQYKTMFEIPIINPI